MATERMISSHLSTKSRDPRVAALRGWHGFVISDLSESLMGNWNSPRRIKVTIYLVS